MNTIAITNKALDKLKPSSKPYFIRDSSLKGFGVKVNQTGSIKFVAEVWHQGQSKRKTLGEYPLLTLNDAKLSALRYISLVKSGQLEITTKQEYSLKDLLDKYTSHGRLNHRTIRDYKTAVTCYLSDWLEKPVASITKPMVEDRFYKIRDKGINGGIPTFSQATKTMRILSALMNYALADELIESNPVQVLKLKRIDRSLQKRENYLPADKVRELIHLSAQDAHPVTLAIQLMLYCGLRKNEALRLMWSDIEDVEGICCLIIRDTKNKRPHYVPVTETIQNVLEKAKNDAAYVFPSPIHRGQPILTERPTIKRLSKELQYDFRCHDLRRTFATRASEVGIDYLTIKRLLNHKSNDITAQYIQWNSRENLLVMRKALERVQY